MHHLQRQKCSLATFITRLIQLFCSRVEIQGGCHTIGETTFYNFDLLNVLAMDSL